MIKKYSALLLSSIICLSLTGCNTGGGGPSSVSAPSSNVSGTASIAAEPSSLVLAPGAKSALKVYSVDAANQRRELQAAGEAQISSSNPAAAEISADGTVKVPAAAKTGSSAVVTVKYAGFTKEVPVTVQLSLKDTVTAGSNGVDVVTNAADRLVVVNKKRALPDGYIPADLVEPKIPFSFNEKSEKRMMRAEAAKALEKLFAEAQKDGIKLYGVSAYRSYITQKALFNNYVRTQGQQHALQYSAQPGTSEHQTGLAIDVSSPSANFGLEESFGQTPEAKWLTEHAPAFGFIIRYPKGKEAVTGYNYEPWHIRYVGIDTAKDVAAKGVTLEEYFQDAVQANKQ